jgi:hypothetical protein
MTSDTIEDYKALAEARKSWKDEAAVVNVELLKSMNIPAYEQSKNVFRVDTLRGVVMYYPTSGKWQHKGKTYRGDVKTFREFLKKTGKLA